MARATQVLKSMIDGTEFDLCPTCLDELNEILQGKPVQGEEIGRKRTAGRPKTVKK